MTFPAHVLDALDAKPDERLELQPSPAGSPPRARRVNASRLAPLRGKLNKAALRSVLTSGLVAPTGGDAVPEALPGQRGCGLMDRPMDETEGVRLICWRSIREKQRKELLNSRLLEVRGTWQREGEVRNSIAGRLVDLTPLPGRLSKVSRDLDRRLAASGAIVHRHTKFAASLMSPASLKRACFG